MFQFSRWVVILKQRLVNRDVRTRTRGRTCWPTFSGGRASPHSVLSVLVCSLKMEEWRRKRIEDVYAKWEKRGRGSAAVTPAPAHK